MDIKAKLAKIENIKKSLEKLHYDLEQDILVNDNGTDKYLDFLEDVHEFIKWTGSKYCYNYYGNNNRVVMRGEIYYCDLGQNIGSEQSNNRPVIVLQNDVGNMHGPTTIVAPITNTKNRLPVHVPMKVLGKDLKTTGVIRLEHLREISKCRLGIFIEKLDTTTEEWKRIDRAIKKSLDVK